MKTTHALSALLVLALLAWLLPGCPGGSLTIGGVDDDDATGDDDTGDDDTGDDDTGDDDTGSGECSDVAQVFDFEGGEAGFTHQSTNGGFADPWELGAPSGEDCTSGDACWATRLDGEYGDCEAGELVSPAIDLSACDGAEEDVVLRFQHLYRLEEAGNALYDGAAVQMSADGDSWVDVEPSPSYTGIIDGNYSECPDTAEIAGHQAWSDSIPGGDWTEVAIRIDESFRTGEFHLRFLFGSDRGVTADGWYVDDVEIAVE